MFSWMKDIPDSRLLSDINLPGTHNSCARYVAFPYFSKCQNLTVSDQLKMGIRLLDIRVEKKKDKLICVHSVVNCRKSFFGKAITLEDVIGDCREFLESNPTETVVISFKKDDGRESDREVFDLFLKRYADNLWYMNPDVPQLGQVRGKLVLLNRCVDSHGLNFTGWKTAEPEKEIAVYSNENFRYVIQDEFQTSPERKWESFVKPMLDARFGDETVLNFISANDSIHSPKFFAKLMNKNLASYNFEKGKKYGWLFFDYPDETIIEKFI